MKKETRTHHSERHYSRKGGHLERSNYWKTVQHEQKLANRRRTSEYEGREQSIFSPLVGVDVLLFEDGMK